ncbi:MAG TPA: endonuclease [Pyrinomonadaceae bacterium]|nr:endonuclease [Pyrinomonadaceae bacterium]
MIPNNVIQETEQRFEYRTPERTETEEKLKSGSKLLADDPQRVEKRLRRLLRGEFASEVAAVAAAPSISAAAAVSVGTEPLALERILNKNNLMSINYLERGLRVARSVARIRIRSAQGRTLGFGTGFMVSPRLLMTNNHVLSTRNDAAFSHCEFNFQDDLTGRPIPTSVFELDPDLFFETDRALDFTLVAVKERARQGSGDVSELRFFGWNRLIEEEGKAILGEFLNIIQHPNGEPKQLALRENEFIDLLDNFLHYKTDTAPGSSGSPVFNDQWEIVGLHHSGVPRKDAAGRILTRDGVVWKQSMGEHKIDWIANEGIRVSRLVKHIKNLALNDAQRRRLRTDLLEKDPPFLPLRDETLPQTNGHSPDSSSQHATAAFSTQPRIVDGSAVWTMPLQVSIKLGDAGGSATVTAPPAYDQNGSTNGGGGTAAKPSPQTEPDSKDLDEAIAELERSRTRKYYDEPQDRADRDQYYADVPDGLEPADLYQHLSTLLDETHINQPKYKPSKHVYPWVDLQPNKKLRSIYSGIEYDPEELIREDFRIDQERTARLQEKMLTESSGFGPERIAEELDLLEAQLPYNCEHVVPQSWFEKREPMRGDIHHLFACESGCNSFRGNTPYFDFSDFEEAVREECGMRIGNKFEPTAGKGTVARAVLYFILRYPGEINRTAQEYEPDRIETLLKWHRENEVSTYEKHRNMAIFKIQGNRNPLIDHPEWADQIDFLEGLD